ncbi:YqhG family protein [Oceanobacillus chungangensis]|uniref:Uncharacterized protein n=1 Tax=Oceanobacillus chungangensis TaxID=1229152 RepID=A0A3D8Q2Q4_9BACI|nr:YqhG family protein [Oceanobacillus chungangensis]RDW21938.1 hypothetical protein CWR45_00150 [Oceanobacillus chungangensis]
MAITNLNHFLQDYFIAHNCEIMDNTDGILTVQLTEEMDLALMNRPFYWHYINKMGNAGQPLQLTLITNPDKRAEKGDWIHFGSPRLQQIMNHLQEYERYTKLFQTIDTRTNTPLYPWLVINMKISFRGKQKKDDILSIGLQLVNGKMRLDMMRYLETIPLQSTISDYCFTISPLIKIKSGFSRIESLVLNYLEDQPKDWAKESLLALNEELDTLNHFYEELEENEQMEKERNEIKERYEPNITFHVINGGIFYLSE